MLTLTITDPANLTDDERNAVLMFAKIRPAGADVRTFVEPTIKELTGKLAAENLERQARAIAGVAPLHPADNPAAGLAPGMPVPPAGKVDGIELDLDPAKVFGGSGTGPLTPTAGSTVSSDSVPAAVSNAASPASATSPPVAGGPPPGVSVQLDKQGLPWDVRIHAGTKRMTAEGAWQKKKGVDDTVRAYVEGELRALMAIPPAVVTPGAPADVTFPQLMAWASKQVDAGKLTHAQISGVVMPMGPPSIIALSSRPDLVPAVRAALEALIPQ